MNRRLESQEQDGAASQSERGPIVAPGVSGWILSLRRLLETVEAEVHRLSPKTRRAFELALEAIHAASAANHVQTSQGNRDEAPGSLRSLLGHDPRVLLVGTAADALEPLFRHLRDATGAFQLTLVHDPESAAGTTQRQPFDLMLYEYPASDLSQFDQFMQLHALPTCPPVIFIARDGSEDLAAAAFKAGVYDYVPRRELTELVLRRTVTQALRRARLEKELEATNQRLGELVNRDPLTGLYNRRCFEDRMAVEFARAQRYHQPLALVLLDLDHFKEINDTYGHPTGDRILIEAAQGMLAISRQIDLVARIGGEEFALLLPNTDSQGALVMAERVVSNVRSRNVTVGNDKVGVTVSAGLAAYPECTAASRMKLFECADRALYRAKETGRNRIARHTPEG
jgi:diguanylate cyclase (GGDEF)-like protein